MTKYYSSIDGFANVQRRKAAYQNIKEWVIQEKIEGMNMSVVIDPARADLPEFNYDGSRNRYFKSLVLRGRTSATTYNFEKVELPSYDDLTDALQIKEGAKMILFGELCGGGIQKEWYFEEPTFVLFDVQYVTKHNTFFFDPEQVQRVAEKIGIRCVPQITVVDYMVDTKEALESLITDSFINPKVKAEGIVAKPRVEILDKFGERVIYKTRYAHFRN